MSVIASPAGDEVAAIARCVLYEGYILWPYRRGALKNQRRWTFGGVYPSDYSLAGHADDPSRMTTQCLLEVGGPATVSVSVRFLQVVERQVMRWTGKAFEAVDALAVNGIDYSTWQEAVERDVAVAPLAIAEPRAAVGVPIVIEAGTECETLTDEQGAVAGQIVRSWKRLDGSVDVTVNVVSPGLAVIRVDIDNCSAWSGEPREQVLARTFVSTHTVLRASGGEFVSQIDPPERHASMAARHRSVGTFPVLAGDESSRCTVLSSPIILYDYPRVAPESPGDLFDGGEIDQLLVLGVLSMTDDEQRRMRATDPRAREILDRCKSLTPDAMLRLHGVTRERPSAEARP